MQSLPALLVHLPVNHGAKTTRNIKKNASNKRLKPKLSAELWMKALHRLCCHNKQWQTMYPYLNHLLSGHPHGSHTKFHVPPLATPQLFTFPDPSGPNPLSPMILGWCYAKGWSPRMIGKHTTHQHPRSHCLRNKLGLEESTSNCANCFRNFLQMNDCWRKSHDGFSTNDSKIMFQSELWLQTSVGSLSSLGIIAYLRRLCLVLLNGQPLFDSHRLQPPCVSLSQVCWWMKKNYTYHNLRLRWFNLVSRMNISSEKYDVANQHKHVHVVHDICTFSIYYV